MTDPLDDLASIDKVIALVAGESVRFLAELDSSPALPQGAAEAAERFGVPLPEQGDGAVATLMDLDALDRARTAPAAEGVRGRRSVPGCARRPASQSGLPQPGDVAPRALAGRVGDPPRLRAKRLPSDGRAAPGPGTHIGDHRRRGPRLRVAGA